MVAVRWTRRSDRATMVGQEARFIRRREGYCMKAMTTLLTALGLIVSAAGGAALCGECDGFTSPETIAGGESCACSEACTHSAHASCDPSIDARRSHGTCRSGPFSPEAAVRPDSRTSKPTVPSSDPYHAHSFCDAADPQVMRAEPRMVACLSRGTPTPAFLSTTFLLL